MGTPLGPKYIPYTYMDLKGLNPFKALQVREKVKVVLSGQGADEAGPQVDPCNMS